MKKLYFIFIALLLIGLTSCSSGKTDEEKAEDMAEGILKQMTGKDVDIKTEKNEDGKTVNMTISTDEGELTVSGNAEELPDDFPDIYIVAGEKSNIGIMASDEGKMITFKISSDDELTEIKEEIMKNMESWNSSSTISSPEGSILRYDKEDNNVTITISKSKDKAEIVYVVSYKTK